MATIHLTVGFMGFGKTTVAKRLEKEINGIRLTHDEFMVRLYGRNMPYEEFHQNYKKVDDMLWDMAEKIINAKVDVIMDYGFWSHEDRKNAYERAKKITDDVVFDVINCDLAVAKQRLLQRSKDNPNELYITENEFDELVKRYKPWSDEDKYPAVFYDTNG